MTTARPFVGVVGATLVALGVRATAQVALPDGPNCDLVVRTCGTCHDISTVVDTGGRSREDWNETIDAMTSFGRRQSALWCCSILRVISHSRLVSNPPRSRPQSLKQGRPRLEGNMR